MANREPGFYWVKPKGIEWQIDEWNGGGWERPLDAGLDDGDWVYEEIDERRIERPEELTPDRVFYDYKQEQGN